MYVIATQSRRRDETLFLVDRSLQRRSFWSNRTDDALTFENHADAQAKAGTLKFNNPRVLTLDQARHLPRAVSALQQWWDRQSEHEEILRELGEGWDGHKDAF